MGYNQHQTTEFKEQMERDLRLLTDLLQTPMNVKQIKEKVKIVGLNRKLVVWVKEGSLHQTKEAWAYYYESPFKKITENAISRIVRPMDSENYKAQMKLYRKPSQKNWAGSYNWNAMI